MKLGTISSDDKADVYSYAEDDMVEDPLLKQHVIHFGINMDGMEKVSITFILSRMNTQSLLKKNRLTNQWQSLKST